MLDQLVTSLDLARHHLSSGIPRLNISFYGNCFSFRFSHSRNIYRRFFFLLTGLNTLDLQNFHQQLLNVSNKNISLPHVGKSRTVLDSGFHAVNSGFQVLDSSICQ